MTPSPGPVLRCAEPGCAHATPVRPGAPREPHRRPLALHLAPPKGEHLMPRRNYRKGQRGRRFTGYGRDWVTRMHELLAYDRKARR